MSKRYRWNFVLLDRILLWILLIENIPAVIAGPHFNSPDLMLLASCESEKNDLVKETVTQWNNRNSKRVKADGFYYWEWIFSQNMVSYCKLLFFATFLIILLELSIWMGFICVFYHMYPQSSVSINWRVKTFCLNAVRYGKTNITFFQILPVLASQGKKIRKFAFTNHEAYDFFRLKRTMKKLISDK